MKNAITDYNVIGDGVTNDSTNLKTAALSGYPVLLPYTPNGYVVDDTLILAAGTHFIGEPGTKIIHKGSKPLFKIQNSFVKIKELVIDSSNTTATTSVEILLDTESYTLKDIFISEIYLTNSYGLISDNSSFNVTKNLFIRDIYSTSPRGSVINITGSLGKSEIDNISIDYTNSSKPNYTAIFIGSTNGITDGILLNNIQINGSNSQSYSNQHGIWVGGGEHLSISNTNIIYMGGVGIHLEAAINFRLSNCNVSFCTGNQIEVNSGGYGEISNCMARGRANGSLSFLIVSTYGLVLTNVSGCTIIGSNFKSCGAGAWINTCSLITFSGCQFPINNYYGVISTGINNIYNLVGCQFAANGLKDILHSGSKQYATNCLFTNSIANFSGIGTK